MRNLFFFVVNFILIIFSSVELLSNNDSIQAKFGVFLGANYNTHSAQFQKLEGIPNCCPKFDLGTGLGYNLGILYEQKLIQNFWLGAKLGIIALDGELKRNENTILIIDKGTIDGAFEHKLTGSFMNVGLEPALIYNPFGGLLVSAGARLGLNITKNYDQVETIVEPPGTGTFMDSLGNDTHSRTRNKFSGEIPKSIPFQIAFLAGISYELPLNTEGNLKLVPEVSYLLPLSDMVENTDWAVTSIRAGIALKYSPLPKPPKKEIFRKELHIDTIKISNDDIIVSRKIPGKENIKTEKIETDNNFITTEIVTRTDTLLIKKLYKLEGSILAVGVDSSGAEIPNPVFKIEEFISNRLDPLLNYVFFDENSFELPNRYTSLQNNQTSKFEVDSLYRESTLDIYYHILNIVGKRMRMNPTANITLIGCNSNLADEKGNLELSLRRTEVVKNYLEKVWGISPDRIKVENRNLPLKASTPIDETDKVQENRRVEIYSDNEKILEPVFIEKLDWSANIPIIRFKTTAESEAGLKSWEINAFQKGNVSAQFVKSGNDIPPINIDWELNKFQKIIPKSAEPIVYSLVLEDKKGAKKKIDNLTLPIKVITIQQKRTERIGIYEVERFSLILFDFDKATIEGGNKNIIDFISNRIKKESEIEISGYTDRTGDDVYNKKLSERRALSTKSTLKRSDAVAIGIGEEKLLYDNALPECRFYCRTVNVEVKTKVE
ncbi:MAG: hypothetical protein HW421_3809 [Ignavibacteria bacterium]|nr:hypothetical protein [Ignavibacteria bacterium]